ncbi:MAG TPA: cytochrome P450 [Pseudonocardiaceae bacterium]|nr:cytochrome P450 [Pseudonocardiaceae bacterium]
MNWPELNMAMRTIPFLESLVDSPDGFTEVTGGPDPRLLVWHPDMIDWIFRNDGRMRHPGGRSLIPLFGTLSPLWAEGPRHAAYRRVLGPSLRGPTLRSVSGIVADAVDGAIDGLAPGAVIELLAWTRGITLRVIARILLGRYDDALLADVTAWIEKAFGATHRTLAYRYLRGGLPKPGAELDSSLVRTAKASTDLRPPTIAARLLSADWPLGRIGDDELRDAVISMLFAGHDTTASAVAWTLFWLDRNPAVRHELAAELAATGADGSDAARAPLLQATVLESLRLTPPATLAEHRLLTEDETVAGRTFAAGTILTPAIYVAHHHPDRFPNPHRFDPNRFLGNHPVPAHFFPFGGSVRHCLGSQLAQMEIRMITAALLRRRAWVCVIPRLGVTRMRGNVMAPARGLRLRVLACRD